MAVDRFTAVVLTFVAFLHVRAWLAPPSQAADHARLVTGLLGLLTLALRVALVRMHAGARARQLALLAPMVGAYLHLRRYLPALQPDLLDAQLLAIDRALFGETPAVWLSTHTGPAVVEWFSFFYYGYFFFLASHLLGTLLFDRGRRADELVLGLLLTTAIGHTLYTCVPGVGPYADPRLFEGPLHGGPFLARVQATVALAGAQLDIFPSLHTAHPALIAMHAARHRDRLPYRFTWAPNLFVATNIVLSTMALRWHYGVDVLAGLVLAWCCHRVACRWLAHSSPTFD